MQDKECEVQEQQMNVVASAKNVHSLTHEVLRMLRPKEEEHEMAEPASVDRLLLDELQIATTDLHQIKSIVQEITGPKPPEGW